MKADGPANRVPEISAFGKPAGENALVPGPKCKKSKTQLWMETLERYDYRCYWCGRKLDPRCPTQDHLTPKSRGGPDTADNIVPCCSACNSRKNKKTASEYREYLKASGLENTQVERLHFYLDMLFRFSPSGDERTKMFCSLLRERVDKITAANTDFLDHHIARLAVHIDGITEDEYHQLCKWGAE